VAREQVRTKQFDLVVVGGGLTGAGILLDAAARGLRVALIERGDFASGTSSKSSKLVHGGLRYLAQHQFRLVAEGLRERQYLLANAPHLVRPLSFLIPLFGSDGFTDQALAKAYDTALTLYDLGGGWRHARHRRISADRVAEVFPALKADRVVAGFEYVDATADDARLTLAVLRTAVLDHGAVALNHAEVVGFRKTEDGRIDGVVLDDGTTISTKVVVNATGVWADSVRNLDQTSSATVRPARGVHIVVPKRILPCEWAAVLPVAQDGRSVFVVPHGDVTYVGTTDTDHSESLDEPLCSTADIDYLLNAVNARVHTPIRREDVVGTWAGLRPLVAADPDVKTKDLSRRHNMAVSDSNVITITGGKLTTYRKMADDAVDAAVLILGSLQHLERPADRIPLPRRSPTRRLRLRGTLGVNDLRVPGTASAVGVSEELLEHLVTRYGGEARVILAMCKNEPRLVRTVVPGLPYTAAEVIYAVRYEMAETLPDVLERRLRARLYARDASAIAAEDVARLMARELDWSEERVDSEVVAYRESVSAERESAGLPFVLNEIGPRS
jgi:glycerol-3-phosphate dehydrogenase